MGAICNGMALHGGIRPYGSTFLIFSDYMRPSVRLAALTPLPVIFVYTHDSIGLGEDGPTHQPIEHLSSLRAMPNIRLIRPSDANEVTVAWKEAISRNDGPTALILTRQKLPILDRKNFGSAEGLSKGAYVLSEASDPKAIKLILIATGSEVHPTLEAQKLLEAKKISTRVVSLPCWELFEEQTQEYQESVIPTSIPARLAVEAASPHGMFAYPKAQIAISVLPFFKIAGVFNQGVARTGQISRSPHQCGELISQDLKHFSRGLAGGDPLGSGSNCGNLLSQFSGKFRFNTS